MAKIRMVAGCQPAAGVATSASRSGVRRFAEQEMGKAFSECGLAQAFPAEQKERMRQALHTPAKELLHLRTVYFIYFNIRW
jgi:hypothetical protein